MFDRSNYTDGPDADVFPIVWQLQLKNESDSLLLAQVTLLSNEPEKLQVWYNFVAKVWSGQEVHIVSQHETQFLPGYQDGINF